MCLTPAFIRNYLPEEISARAAVACGPEDETMLGMMIADACALLYGKLAQCYALPLTDAATGSPLDLTENASHTNANAPSGSLSHLVFWWIARRVITYVRYQLASRGPTSDAQTVAVQPWYIGYRDLLKELEGIGTCAGCSCKALPGLVPAATAPVARAAICDEGHVWQRRDVDHVLDNAPCHERAGKGCGGCP